MRKIVLLFFLVFSVNLDAEEKNIVIINFEGNSKVDADAIAMNISSKENAKFSEEVVSQDVKNIYNMGYFESVRAEFEEVDDGVILSFVLKEKPFVRTFEVQGNDAITIEKINESIKVKQHSFLDEVALKESTEAILSQYADEGYFIAEIKNEFVDMGNNEITVRFKIDEGEKVKVKKIYFPVIEDSVADEIKSIMGTKEANYFSWLTGKSKYKREELFTDISRVESYFMDRGYVNVKVEKPIVTISEDRRWIYISIFVERGDQFKIGKIDIAGDLIFNKDDMMKDLKSRENEYFNRSIISEDINNLTELYGKLGYANANINPLTRVDPDEKSVDLTLKIRKNKLAYIDKINITGNTKTRDKVVRRELKIQEGELYNIDRIKFSRERIYARGFFEEVDFSTKPGSEPSLVNLDVRVKEGNTGTLTAGFGFSSIDQFIFTTQMSFGNFLGYGQKFSINAELGSRRQVLNASFFEPYFMDSDWSFGSDMYITERTYLFRVKRTGGNLRWGYLVGDYTRLFVQYKYEDTEVKDTGATDTRLFTSGVTSSLTFSLSRDTRDHPFDTSKGSVLTGSVEVASRFLGGDFDFAKFDVSFSKFFPLFAKTVLMFKAQGGYGRTMGDDRLPFSERYLLGGPNDVRGYNYWSVGPLEPIIAINNDPASPTIDKPVGGNKMTVFNAEYLFNIFKPAGIKGVLFFDAGNAYNEEESFFKSPLRMGWGFGIRWFTPVAPFRFEWGFPIHRMSGERASVFEFSIGTLF